MYYPIEYRTIQDLLNVVETNWVVLISEDGKIMDTSGNLQFFADLPLANAVRFDKDDPSADEVIARWEQKGTALTKEGIFVFADYYEIADAPQTVDDFVGDLIESGKAIISDAASIKYYTPTQVAVVEETKGFAVDDVLQNENGTQLTVAKIGGKGAIDSLTVTAGGRYLSRRAEIVVASTTGTTESDGDAIPVTVIAWGEYNV